MFVITFAPWLTIRNHSSSSWRFFLTFDPFLVNVMTLNGIINIMPVTSQSSLRCLPATSKYLFNLMDQTFIFARRSCSPRRLSPSRSVLKTPASISITLARAIQQFLLSPRRQLCWPCRAILLALLPLFYYRRSVCLRQGHCPWPYSPRLRWRYRPWWRM